VYCDAQIRPGNFVFLDRTPVRMGLFSVKDVALSVLVTVVSSSKYYFIVDAGSKVFSSDAYGPQRTPLPFPPDTHPQDSNAG
jgi:D-serine deaminase-like pyridoxal phosphate-dependent protein